MKILLGALITMAFLCASPATAAEYFVRASGSNSAAGTAPESAWATVAYAATRVSPGDTVYVGAGTYSGQVSVTASGTVANPIRFFADISGARTGDAGAVTIQNTASQPVVLLNNSDYIRFSGFVIQGGQSGVLADSTTGVIIEDCVLDGARDQGMTVRNGASVTVTGCTVRNAGHGIVIPNGTATVADSVLTELSGDAVVLQNTNSVAEFRRCRIIDVRRGAQASNGRLALINTLIHEASSEGVYTQNNTVLVMVHCTVDSTSREGARFRGNSTLYNNIFSNINSHCMRFDGGKVTASHTLVYNRRGHRSNRFNSLEFEFDPEYSNPSADDFTLSPDSDALDVAMDQSAYTLVDLTGKDRPEGTGSDLGAYEGSAPPKVFFVRTDGSDADDGLTAETAFRTIQHAISLCSSPGSTVHVAPGVYNEALAIGTGAGASAVSGARSSPTRVIADVGGVNTLVSPGPVVLDGRRSSSTAIDASGVSYWSIEGFEIRNYRFYGVRANGAAISLISCTVEVPGRYAYYGTPRGDVTIQDCVFERDTGSAHMLWVWNTSSSSDVQVLIDRNRFEASDAVKAATNYGGGYRWSRNGYQYGIIVANYAGQGSSSIVIRNNLITDSYLPIYALTRSGGIPSEVVNNTVTDSFYSIYLYDRNRTGVAVNNLISGCYFGLIAANRRATVRGHAEHAITYDMNRYRRAYIPSNMVTDSPMFADASTGDYSLQAGSPCADAGSAYHAPGSDLDGRSRPVDGDDDGEASFDIGAIEYVTGSVRRRIVRWQEISPIGED